MNRVHPIYKSFYVVVLSLALLGINSVRKKWIFQEKHVCENGTSEIVDTYEDIDGFLPLNNVSTQRSSSMNNDTQKLFILGLFELSTKWGKRKEGTMEMLGAQLAVKHINSLEPTKNYHLELLVNDTMCDPGVGVDRLFHALYSKYPILMLLGTGCSNVTKRLAQIVPYWNIIQVSFGSSSPYLSDRSKFPLFFRTATSDSSHNTAKVQFVKTFGWKVVAVFTEDDHYFLMPVNSLIADLEKADVLVGASITFSLENYKEQLQVLKNLNVRIIFGSFSSQMTSKILCAAQDMEMLDKYVWIIQERDNFEWQISDCKLEGDITGIITLSDFHYKSNGCLPIQKENLQFTNEMEILKKYPSSYPRYSYDAVWSMFYALKDIHVDKWFDMKEDLYYLRKSVVERLVDKMDTLTFFGLSGPVRFNHGDRIANSLFRQVQAGELKPVAIFDSIKDKLNFTCPFCNKIVWKNNEIPIARRILKISKTKIPDTVFATIVLFSLLGITISMSFLVFNLRFKRRRYVKLSSPNLTNITVIGCTLVYLSVIILGVNNSSINLNKYFDAFCSVEICDCHNITGWYMALLGYKTMFILMGIYMAWKTRHIKIPVLNDSQYIGICIYTTVFSTMIVITLNIISNSNIILTYIIQSAIILIVTTIIMFFMFLPIINSVYGKRDSADPIMQSMGLTNVSNTRRFIFNDSKETLNRLEIQNKVYRCHLMKLDNEIMRLENLLRN